MTIVSEDQLPPQMRRKKTKGEKIGQVIGLIIGILIVIWVGLTTYP